MDTNSEMQELRSHVGRYLSGTTPLGEFMAWFTPFAQAMDDCDGTELGYALDEVMHRTSEYSNGDWTEEQLRSFFEALVELRDATSANNEVATGVFKMSVEESAFNVRVLFPA